MRMFIFGRSGGVGGVPVRSGGRTRRGIVFAVRAGPARGRRGGSFMTILRGCRGHG